MRELPERTAVEIEGRRVVIRVWRREITGVSGHVVPVLFLDTLLDENSEEDRDITGVLYGGDERHRLKQEAVLGLGGVRLLQDLGCTALERFHMNEGHAALLTIELLREHREAAGRTELEPADLEAVRRQCVFTTHTPVSAGHDRFSLDLAEQVLGSREACGLHDPVCHEGRLNMTYLALAIEPIAR